jgi:hypothetical protein
LEVLDAEADEHHQPERSQHQDDPRRSAENGLAERRQSDDVAGRIGQYRGLEGEPRDDAGETNTTLFAPLIRPLEGEAPTIDLAVGYSNSNTSPILKLFLSRIEELTDRISSEARPMSGPRSAAAPQ